MSLKRFCLVPSTWDARECSLHTCSDGSHVHLSRRQLWDLEVDGLVEWIHTPVNRRDKGIVRIRRLVATRGLSCRVGPELAEALRRKLPWALAMMADITLKPSAQVRE